MHLLEEKIGSEVNSAKKRNKIGSEVNSAKKRNKIEWILQMYVHVL